MNQLMTIWITTVSLLVLALFIRTLFRFRSSIFSYVHRHRLVEMEKEANLFYCPGDIKDDKQSHK